MQLSQEQQQLVEDNLALVRRVIRDRVRGIGSIGLFTYDDLYQIGCIGLCKAAYTDKYQYAYNRGNAHSEDETRFSTYAYRLIWNEICTMLGVATKARAELVTAPGDIQSFMETAQTHMDDTIAGSEFQAVLEHTLNQAAQSATGVTAKGIQALRYVAQGYTAKEIGTMMGGASDNNVTAWISKARKYLRNNPELAKLLSVA